ncbi:MAG: hypothetical protein ACRDP6_42735, partial [Actinoallomurus sp.]
PQQAPRTTACQKINKGEITALYGFRVACLSFFIRSVRLLLPVAGLVLAFWAFSALTPAHADTLPPHAIAPARVVPHGPLAANDRTTAVAPALRRSLHALRQHPRRTRAAPLPPVVRRLHVLHTVRRTVRSTGATILRPIQGATPGRTGPLVDPYPAAPEQNDHPACDPPRPAPPGPSSAVHRARTVPATWSGLVHRPETPVAAPFAIKETGTISRAPATRMRTLPAPPGFAPVSGQGENDCAGGKTPTGTGDVPRVSLRPPGLWCVAHRQDRKIGRNIADKPSCSPD